MISVLWLSVALAGDDAGLQTGLGTPYTIGDGHGAVGVFSPLVIGLGERTDLTTSGWASLVAPRVDLKHRLTDGDGVAVAVLGGLGVPSLGLSLLQGTILSSDPKQPVGAAAVFKAGVLAGVQPGDFTLSIGVEGRASLRGAGWGLESPGWFWLDPMLAPLTEGPVVRTRWVVDWLPDPTRFAVRLDGWVQLGGLGPDWTQRLLLQYALGRNTAIGVGYAVAWERFAWGRDHQVQPLVDLRFRW